ncbi:MAG TPA: ATP-binding protein [Lentisphaeria bacterium]|nr:ATP-binding protein [Lentisphaeria bacterium]
MSQRDKVLFLLPATAIALVVLFTVLLFTGLTMFKQAFHRDADSDITEKTALVALILNPLLDQGNLDEAKHFCNNFDRDALRLSLIRIDGKVEADSAEKAALLSNHLNREEVQAAIAGAPICVTRFSESLNQWMTYHAVRLEGGNREYILRTAISTDRTTRILQKATMTSVFALLLGGALALALALYIFSRVRTPLRALHQALTEITEGNLDAPIPIPSAGIVRDFATRIAEMTTLLRANLATVMATRNEQEAILNSMEEAVLLVNRSGDAIRVNRAAASLFQLTEQQAFNLSRSGMPNLLPQVQEALKSGQPFEKEYELSSRAAGKSCLLIKGATIDKSDGDCLLLTVTDLTRLRRLESFRSDFIANVSHELKTPLTCIIGAAEAILEEKDLPPEQMQKLVTMLYEQSSRLNLLVQDILSLSAIEHRQSAQNWKAPAVALDAVLGNAIAQNRELARENGVEIQLTESVPIEIPGDSQLLEQAMGNLLSNAVKYSGSPTIEVSLSRQNCTAVVEVKDFGIGIADAHKPRIFERFYRVHKERSRAQGGTGLGLAIVKHVASVHHGAATLTDTPGGGCTFRIILPIPNGSAPKA